MMRSVLQFVQVPQSYGEPFRSGGGLLQKESVSSPQASKPRAQFIDITRGILLLLMINSHALFLAGVPESSFWNSLLWFPRGVATQSFIILSGFSMGYIFSKAHRGLAESQRRLFQRGKEIFLVMFVSNIFFLVSMHYVEGNAAILNSLDWWLGLFTFHTPYSISAILIPTGLLAFLTPLLLYGQSRGFTKFIFLVTIACSFLVAGWQESVESQSHVSHLLQILLGDGIADLTILPLLSYGLIGASLGIMWNQHRSTPLFITIVASICFLGYLAVGSSSLHQVLSIPFMALGGPVKFCLILVAGMLIAQSLPTSSIGRYLSLIGNFSLFCFLAHRIVLQLLLIPLQSTSFLTPESLFGILFFGTLVALGVLCWMRKSSPAFSKILKKAYL